MRQRRDYTGIFNESTRTATRRDLCDGCDSSVASNDNALDRAGQRFHRRSAEGQRQLSDAADERHDPRDPLADESNQRDEHVGEQDGAAGP